MGNKNDLMFNLPPPYLFEIEIIAFYLDFRHIFTYILFIKLLHFKDNISKKSQVLVLLEINFFK